MGLINPRSDSADAKLLGAQARRARRLRELKKVMKG